MPELQQFEGDRVSRVNFEKNRVKFLKIPSKIAKQSCIFSSNLFLNNNYYIINHNIAIFYFIFVIKNKNKNANKQWFNQEQRVIPSFLLMYD